MLQGNIKNRWYWKITNDQYLWEISYIWVLNLFLHAFLGRKINSIPLPLRWRNRCLLTSRFQLKPETTLVLKQISTRSKAFRYESIPVPGIIGQGLSRLRNSEWTMKKKLAFSSQNVTSDQRVIGNLFFVFKATKNVI